MEAIERLRFLSSFGLPITGKRKGGQKMQPFNRFHSHPGIAKAKFTKKAISQLRISLTRFIALLSNVG